MPSPSARMGVLLAMRRLGDPEIARFLKDADPRLVLEAARAINDVPIDGAMPALADVPMSSDAPVPMLRRVLNAHLRRGHAEDAVALAEAAGRADLPAAVRVQALEMLGHWASPPGRDAVMGLWRPIAPRPAAAGRRRAEAEVRGHPRRRRRTRSGPRPSRPPPAWASRRSAPSWRGSPPTATRPTGPAPRR